jgi:hypothetical protein
MKGGSTRNLIVMARAFWNELRHWAWVSTQTMTAFKRTAITVETDRVWVVSKSHLRRGWCAACDRETDFVDLKEEPALWGITPASDTQLLLDKESANSSAHQQRLLRGADRTGLHKLRAADGSTLICLESLRKSL